ncbi:MAG: hypothetical protein ACFBSF_08160 [Leptolyngbyaceae cyanobacterium]
MGRCLRYVGYFLAAILVIASCSWIAPPVRLSSSTVSPAPPTINSEILAGQELVPLATPGPWRDVTQLIGYGDRLWFTNSVAGTNHNSADLYSYDPATQTTRYEQHLFSQDAGEPVVAEGLLYWPFEDPRFSADLGEYMVTNGERWQWRVLPEGEAFHVHTMTAHQGMLWAGTGAWAAGLQRSRDGGQTWEVIYDHPTPPRQVTRLTELASLGNTLYGGFTALQSRAVQLCRWDTDTFKPVEAWPAGKRIIALTPYRDWLYGINQNLDDSVTLWRTNGQAAEPVAALAGYRIRALATDDSALWAISTDPAGAFLWHSVNGVDWMAAYQFEDMQPLDLTIFQGHVYVGARNPSRQGMLLGPQPMAQSSTEKASPAPTVPPLPPGPPPPDSQKVTKAVQQLETVLAAPATYRDGNTQDNLAQALLPLAESQTALAGEQLSQQLDSALPQETAMLFENNVQEPATDVVRWYLLWAIGLNGQGRVPIDLLTQPWTTPSNDREKYWQTVPAAAWTIAQIGQSDRATLAALIERLSASEDPLWLTGDIVGALSALTGQTFGYDSAAWQNWWRSQPT